MKKSLTTAAMALFVSIPTFSGGLFTNTNQHAAFLRMPARGASIAIDGVNSNPAGIAFLPQGFHLSFSWQVALQERQIDSTNKLFEKNTNDKSSDRSFKGTTKALFIPSFQGAYVINDKWSISAQFAVGSGGGKCTFEEGLPMFEKLIGGTLAKANATSYELQQRLVGEQYFYGIQLGGTYRITDNFSLFAGARGVIANCSYIGNISNIQANEMEASNYLLAVKGVIDKKINELPSSSELYKTLTEQSASLAQGAGLMSEDFILDCKQRDFAITPIIGFDWKFEKLNIGAKYEFRTKVNLKNNSLLSSDNVLTLMPDYENNAKVRSDIPAYLSIAAQYKILPKLRASVEYHFFDDKAAKIGRGINKNSYLTKGTNEYLFGIEWDALERVTFSGGIQSTDYGLSDDYQSDTSFFCDSFSFGFGAEVKVNDNLNLNVGYFRTNYKDYKKVTDANIYSRKNQVIGVSVNWSL